MYNINVFAGEYVSFSGYKGIKAFDRVFILKYYIEDIYIVLEPADYDKISIVLSIREIFNVNIYIVSDVKNILVTSSVKIHPFSNIAYIEVPKYLLSTWQSILKRTIDIFKFYFMSAKLYNTIF